MGKVSTDNSSRTSTVVYCGLIVALMVVSSWITIPLGIVPVTLQVFVMVFAFLFLTPRQFFISLVVYLSLGAIGLPVFSGMRGGFGVLLGPTGGFLWGYILGAIAAYLLLFLLWQKVKNNKTPQTLIHQNSAAVVSGASSLTTAETRLGSGKYPGLFITTRSNHSFGASIVASLVFLIVVYLCGWLQLMEVARLDPAAAFLAGVAPFIVIDFLKIVVAVVVAQAVKTSQVIR